MSGNKIALAILVALQVYGSSAETKQNQFRADHHVAPLKNSYLLAIAAKKCAEQMVRDNSDPKGHPCNPGSDHQGENIYTIAQSNVGRDILEVAINSWYNEVRNIDFTNPHWYMVLKTNDPNKPVGHFTQLEWKKSVEVGCGAASGPTVTHVVCRYSPAGNTFTAVALKNNVIPNIIPAACSDQDHCDYMDCSGSFKAMAEQMCPKKCGMC